MTMIPEPEAPPGPASPDGPTSRGGPGGRGNPLASPWLTASLALIVVGLIAANILLTNLARLPGESPPTSVPPTAPVAAGSPSASPSPSFTRPTPTPLPTFITYVVAAGDSLNSIAARFGTKARSIAWWNRGRYPNLDPESPTYNPGLIEVGWTLVLIPGVTVDEEHPPSPSPGRATPTPPASPPASPGGGSPSPSP
jgi:hypothetical protein